MRILWTCILTLSLGASMANAGKLGDYDPQSEQPDIGYRLTDAGVEKLDEIGFVARPTRSAEIYDLYSEFADSPHTPMFISADLTFHTLHLTIDYSVRVMEIKELLPRLEKLTAGMLVKAADEYKKTDEVTCESARAEYIYFAVAASLLGVQQEISDEEIARAVDKEIEKIEEHSGIKEVEFLEGVKEDYSQYAPRGHYTRSDDFKRYFKAMMWFGRLPLHVPRDDKTDLTTFKTSLLVSMHLAADEELTVLWEEIYEPTAFFFGAAEDLTPGLLHMEAEDFFDEKPDKGILADEAKLYEFASYLRKNIKPRILGEFAPSGPGDAPIEVPLSTRFMPQRFVPDSYIFSQMVFDRVTSYQGSRTPKPFTWGNTDLGPMRIFPRGLDAMAVLRWTTALQILKREGDTDYAGYDEQFEKMMRWYATLPAVEKESSIYFRWFDLFLAYKDAHAPARTDGDAWGLKKLTTALGSWTELRHDAILYAKQSYTAYATGAAPGDYIEPPPPVYKAVIEEAPALYGRTAQCARAIADFPAAEKVKDHFTKFADIADRLEELSVKQNEGKSLTEAEHRWLWDVSDKMWVLTKQLQSLAVTTDTDKRMALVADVHTDPNSGQVLEEATGYPAVIYVLADIDGKSFVARGGMFTYYEFRHPLSDRLTDEAWQKMLDHDQAPALPGWSEPFLIK